MIDQPIGWPLAQKLSAARGVRSLGVVLLVGALATLIGVRLAAPPEPVASLQARGGALVSTIRAEPRTFNRFVARDAASDLISVLLHARLVRINRETQQLEPWLAREWVSSEDGLTHTLKLREGVKFSDGVPFSSADVVFAFEVAYDENGGSVSGDALKIAGQPIQIEAPDEFTIVLTFPAPFAPGLRLLDSLPILPRHRLEGAFRSGTFRDAWTVATPPEELAGLGPFVLAEYVPGQRLVFLRNEHYWRRDGDGVPLPYLDRLTLQIVSDQDAELLRLESGQIDFTQSEIRPQDYSVLRRAADAGRIRLIDLGVGLDPNFLWFNLRPEAKAADPRREWLQSVYLRRAISHAVDREAFANTVFYGAGVAVHGPITPANRLWYTDAIPVYAYDPGRARELLAQLGLRDRTGDGMLEDRTGQPARFSILTQRGHTERERGATVLQEDLRRIGLAVDVVGLEPGALVDRILRTDYDAIYFGTNTSDTDPALNLEFWLSSGSFHAWNPAQPVPATEWERQIDELMRRLASTLDYEGRKQLFDEVQRIFAEQLPAIYFVAPRVYVALSARVANATPVVLRPPLLWNPDVLAVHGAPHTSP